MQAAAQARHHPKGHARGQTTFPTTRHTTTATLSRRTIRRHHRPMSNFRRLHLNRLMQRGSRITQLLMQGHLANLNPIMSRTTLTNTINRPITKHTFNSVTFFPLQATIRLIPMFRVVPLITRHGHPLIPVVVRTMLLTTRHRFRALMPQVFRIPQAIRITSRVCSGTSRSHRHQVILVTMVLRFHGTIIRGDRHITFKVKRMISPQRQPY